MQYSEIIDHLTKNFEDSSYVTSEKEFIENSILTGCYDEEKHLGIVYFSYNESVMNFQVFKSEKQHDLAMSRIKNLSFEKKYLKLRQYDRDDLIMIALIENTFWLHDNKEWELLCKENIVDVMENVLIHQIGIQSCNAVNE